ncbi:MAG: type III pantothenate kinase [Candidatus Zixiibacteriota bacterium]|nr:MAG: type III pantothenate kinase [candidate division Zixibacteria bacterium]
MFLAIDIGNTTTMIGFFEGSRILGSFRIESSRAGTPDECGILAHQLLGYHVGDDKAVGKIGICSVVPPLTQIYVSMAKKYFNTVPLLLDHNSRLDFKILYDVPEQVGGDRLANAAAARVLYGYPCIIVDLGTATTYDVINSDGDYAGGLISPGLWTSASNLFKKASKLFPVKIEKPDKAIATDTANSIKSGLYYGFIGQMEYLVNLIKRNMKAENIKVIATGGFSDIFTESDTGVVDHLEPSLTLKGLQIVFDGGQNV